MPVPISTTARASSTEARKRSAAPPPEPIGDDADLLGAGAGGGEDLVLGDERLGVGPARGLDRRGGEWARARLWSRTGRAGAGAGTHAPAPVVGRSDAAASRREPSWVGAHEVHRQLSGGVPSVRKDSSRCGCGRGQSQGAPVGEQVETTREPTARRSRRWDEVVEQHSDRVYRLAYRLTGNRPDAEDLTQEVFVRVFRSLDTYTPGTFEGWLHRITTNLFLDQARRKQRIRFDALSDERAARLTSAAPAPDARATPTAPSTTTSSARSPPCRPTSAPPWCCATSRA